MKPKSLTGTDVHELARAVRLEAIMEKREMKAQSKTDRLSYDCHHKAYMK